MVLADIADMKEYLEERCYCPYEIYDLTGFFFDWFKPETECRHLISGERDAIHGDFVIAQARPETPPQIVYIEQTDGRVDSCVRFDATDNNIRQVIDFMAGKTDELSFDEFRKGETAKTLSEILRNADAICFS